MRISRRAATGVAAPSEWITGDAWIEAVAAPDAAARNQVDRVRFAPGARTVWHRHPAGQTLVVTEGVGRAQRRGGSVETIRVGDSVHVEPGEWHWHGAAPATGMTHLAVEPIPQDGTGSEAGAPVTDREYRHDDAADDAADGAEDLPPITRAIVMDQVLRAPSSTHRVQVRRITIAPGRASGLHVHNGPVFGSVETGSCVYQVDGEPATVLAPGDVFHEPEGFRIARFDARDEGVTFLGYFLLDAGQEAAIEFPDS